MIKIEDELDYGVLNVPATEWFSFLNWFMMDAVIF